MNKIWKQIIVIILIIMLDLNNNSLVVFANDKKVDTDNMIEFELSVEDLKNGVSVVMFKNDNGDISSYVCEDITMLPMNCSVDDGSVELAILHVGFREWSDNQGSLYFTFECDEATSKLQGNFYVKKTGFSSGTYWSGANSYNMFGCHTTTRYIKQHIDVGNATSVIVGFNSVTFETVQGETGWFSNSSQMVNK